MEVTNHTGGMRGINLKGGTTQWVEPGQTVTIDKAEVVGKLPDFGRKPQTDDDAKDADRLAAALSEIDALKIEIKDKDSEIAALKKAAKA